MNMRTDTVIRNEGTQVLMDNLGLVETESFDYTRWQENLFENMSIEEISQKATDYRNSMNSTQ